MSQKWLNKTSLEGTIVRLEPLEKIHEAGIIDAASDGELWHLWYTSVPPPEKAEAFIDHANSEFEKDTALPFVVIEKDSGKVVGSTRFMNADPTSKRLEIGHTWYARSVQRTGVNTECKFLLLSYAFEELNCIAVEFRTHWHNQTSRTAIARLGAKQDGVLRNHKIDKAGNLRDTVVFSIIRSEWNTVKKNLSFKMSQK
ncbi:MAG: GNAT family protein [Bacteroidota bacterium]